MVTVSDNYKRVWVANLSVHLSLSSSSSSVSFWFVLDFLPVQHHLRCLGPHRSLTYQSSWPLSRTDVWIVPHTSIIHFDSLTLPTSVQSSSISYSYLLHPSWSWYMKEAMGVLLERVTSVFGVKGRGTTVTRLQTIAGQIDDDFSNFSRFSFHSCTRNYCDWITSIS